MFQGKPLYFAGANNYYLIYKSATMVDAVLNSAQALGLKVIRTWGFIDRGSLDGTVLDVDPPGHKEGIYFQYWDPATALPAYNDGPNGLQRLDYVIFAAAQRGIKLIIPLVNNWKDFGGMDQYLAWYGLTDHDQFYTDPNPYQAYQSWVLHLLNRTNIYTGKQYKSDPTIMAWELANEPRCRPSNLQWLSLNAGVTTLLNWIRDMSAFIKQNDSEHLVGVGDEGFFNYATGPDWLYNGSQGVDFEAFLEIEAIDFGTFHLYPDHWKKSADWGTHWIREHLNAALRVGKPLLLEEYGLKDPVTRLTQYKKWTEVFKNQGGGGDLFWMLAAQQEDGSLSTSHDDFTLF